MLLGREAELGRLDGSLTELAEGRGGSLLLRGEAGIGKSALLAELAERAGERGVRVLAVRGVESESELAFSGLSDLVGPLVDQIPRLPEPQAAALAGALTLGPPHPGDRLAVCAALRNLLDRVSDTQPTLAIVDDLHWLDGSSRQCVVYAARRAAGRVFIVMSARDGEYDAAEISDLAEMIVAPLDERASLGLLDQRVPGLARNVAAAVVDVAAGVPLALVELATMLSIRERAGEVTLPEPLGLTPRLADIYSPRLAGLTLETRRALTIAAVYSGDELRVVGAACRGAGLDPDALAAGERAGLVRLGDGRISFVHPIARSAVHQMADAAERRMAHRAVAAAVEPERAAWHLGLAAIGPDERAARALEDAGAGALARRGPGPASRAFERAARLSTSTQAFALRMLQAGEAAAAAGQHRRADGLLREAGDAAGGDTARSAVIHARAQALIWAGAVDEAVGLLGEEGRELQSYAPARAARLFADAAVASTGTGDVLRALELSERALDLVGGTDGCADAAVLVARGWAMVLRGENRAAQVFLRRATAAGADIDPLAHGAQWHNVLMRARLASGEFGEIHRESRALCERARERGAVGALPGSLVVFADAAYRLGDWERCEAACREAMRAASDTGQHLWRGYALVVLARVEAALGRENQSREAALAALRVAEAVGVPAGLRYAHAVLGFLDLSLGHVEAAAATFSALEDVVGRSGIEEQVLIPWAADAVETYVAAGRLEDAERVLGALERRARDGDIPFLDSLLMRARGIVADDFDGHFSAALGTELPDPSPFERGRTLLAYGRRLHRARRRVEARARLRDARELFTRLSAAPWLAQATAELRAAGGRERAGRSDGLTDQEWRIARAAATGSTNREIAHDLYLSPKTIEFHLGNVYRKLGLRSRTELAVRLAQETADALPEGLRGSAVGGPH